MATYGIPHGVFWSVAAVGMAIGLASLLAPERIVRCLRVWLIRQLKWVRSPRYRTYLKLNGWLLLVLGALVMLLLGLVR